MTDNSPHQQTNSGTNWVPLIIGLTLACFAVIVVGSLVSIYFKLRRVRNVSAIELSTFNNAAIDINIDNHSISTNSNYNHNRR